MKTKITIEAGPGKFLTKRGLHLTPVAAIDSVGYHDDRPEARRRPAYDANAHFELCGTALCGSVSFSIDVHFPGQFCYIDAYTEPSIPPHFDEALYGETVQQYLDRSRKTPIHLCRLRYFGSEEGWSMALYTYSNEKYEPCVFDDGGWTGTPEQAFQTAAVYLQ